MFGSRYMPGTFALSGSPLPEVDRMKYCAFAAAPQAGRSASALRGLSRNEVGSPVASERSPIQPAPKRNERSIFRRELIMGASSHPDADERRGETGDDEGGLERVRGALPARD